jgi:Zn-dependent protease with chaperone function
VTADMSVATLAACALTALFALIGPRLARRLPPAAATRLLIPASLVVAASGVWVLIAVGFMWVAQFPAVSRYGEWSAEQVREDSPFPTVIAIGCTLLAVLAVGRAATAGTRRIRILLAVRQSCRRIGAPGSLVVLDNDRPDAFATPGASGRIVITTGLLRALTVDERRALLAHEASHLAHRHAWWLLAAEALAATGGDVPGRVRALLEPPPRQRVIPLAVLAVLLVATTVAAGTVQRRGDELLDQAGTNTPMVVKHSSNR